MIERSFGNLESIKDILDGHLLIPFGVDELLCCIEDFVASHCVVFDNPCHEASVY
jgi:hypothetical protein